MSDIHLTPETEALVRGLAEDSNQDVSSVVEALLLDGLAAARNRSFDRKLQKSIEAGLRTRRDLGRGFAYRT